jgi:hypothetical protein
MRLRTIHRSALAASGAALATLACVGCTNAPGALELRVVPEKDVFQAGEPIRLRATLTATGGNVCYGRDSPWAVILEPADAARPIRSDGGNPAFESRRMVFCGGAIGVLAPLFVVIVPACALDVGDGLGRFEVLVRGQQREYDLALVPYEDSDGQWLEVGRDREADMTGRPPSVLLPGGRYRVRAELQNQHSFVAPLFWTPYEHPIVATSEFTIVDGPAATAGQ